MESPHTIVGLPRPLIWKLGIDSVYFGKQWTCFHQEKSPMVSTTLSHQHHGLELGHGTDRNSHFSKSINRRATFVTGNVSLILFPVRVPAPLRLHSIVARQLPRMGTSFVLANM